MTNALFEMSAAEVLERIAAGDTESVIANIADPLERREAEEVLCHLRARAHGEDLRRARHLGAYQFKRRLVAALRSIDQDLGRDVEAVLDELVRDEVRDLAIELEGALSRYVKAQIGRLLDEKAPELPASETVEVPADITPDAPVISFATAQAVYAGHPTVQGLSQ